MKRNTQRRMFTIVLLSMLLIILCCSQFMLLNVKAQSSSGPYLILFDEAHYQYYSYSNGRFRTALDYLNQTADFEVHLNFDEFLNSSMLSRYDLIIIGNPGPNGTFSSNETNTLNDYSINGGNLILLCNYNDVGVPTPDENITGKSSNLNNITRVLNLPVQFTPYDLWDDEHNPIGKRSVVEQEDQNFETLHPLSWKIKKVLTFTSGLNVTVDEGIIATGYSDSYLKNETGPTITATPWLYATQKDESRIILCGSTVIFSDVNVTDSGESSYVGILWINALDNKRLWANMIQWAIITENPNFFTIYLTVICVIVAAGICLIVYNTYFAAHKTTIIVEIEKEQLREERAKFLKEARARVADGMYLAAAQLYKKASKLSNKLGDYEAETLYYQKHRKFLKKYKK